MRQTCAASFAERASFYGIWPRGGLKFREFENLDGKALTTGALTPLLTPCLRHLTPAVFLERCLRQCLRPAYATLRQ